MIITISGMPGSGKSTIAKILAEKLGYKHLSGGDLRGQIALKHGLTIDELNKIGEKEIWTDKEVDDKLVKIAKNEDNYVIDSWIAFHFIPQSIKIFLDVRPEEGAKRVFENPRPDEDKKKALKETEKMLNIRVETTRKRYKKYYNVDFLDKKNYDFILDTSDLSIEQVTEKVLNFIKCKSKV